MLSDVSSKGSFLIQIIIRMTIDFPQLLLFVYYSLFVLKTGLPLYGVISMAMSGILFMILILRFIWHHFLFNLITSNAVVTSLPSNNKEIESDYNILEG